LAQFLRSRRAQITPADVGMPPGPRRRTPGLRREEVAQLAGVGITWYTWLEQGRPINASPQVLNAVARTLRMDDAESDHLYRLADVPIPSTRSPDRSASLPEELPVILDALDPLPAAVYNERWDLLARNEGWLALFPAQRLPSHRHGRQNGQGQPNGSADPCGGNVLRGSFAMNPCCHSYGEREYELALMVATLRAAYGRHLGEPEWTEFVDSMCADFEEFAEMWARHEVRRPGPRIKAIHHPGVGDLNVVATSMTIVGTPDARLVTYTPVTPHDEKVLAESRANPDPLIGCPIHAEPLSVSEAGPYPARWQRS
jgi:transcriptional regulator with XRE-family HTH domain